MTYCITLSKKQTVQSEFSIKVMQLQFQAVSSTSFKFLALFNLENTKLNFKNFQRFPTPIRTLLEPKYERFNQKKSDFAEGPCF